MATQREKHRGSLEFDTAWVLVARHRSPLIPLADVADLYFGGITTEKLFRKISTGEIDLPVTRMGTGQKAAKYVRVERLAEYMDRQSIEGDKEAS